MTDKIEELKERLSLLRRSPIYKEEKKKKKPTKEEKFNNIAKNTAAIFKKKEERSKYTFSSKEAETFKKEIENVKLGNFPETYNEEIDGQYLRELLDRRREERNPHYISMIPIAETRKYQEDNKTYAQLREEHKKVAEYISFQDFVELKIKEEKSKKVPSLKLIQQYDQAIAWDENLMIVKEWEAELLES